MKHEPYVIERTYNAPVDKVWQALTDPAKMKHWYFDIPGFKPEVGNTTSFTAGDKTAVYKHEFKVLEAVPNKLLKHSWSYPDLSGMSTLTIELTADGDKTHLKLIHEGLESFAENGPAFMPESFNAGWTAIIGKNLPDYLSK